MEYFELNDGNKIPAIGFGVFMIPADGPTYEAVLAALEAGADALRINPGNIGSREGVQAVARAAKARGAAIRVGVNLGSLRKDLRAVMKRMVSNDDRVTRLEDQQFTRQY